MTSKFNINKNIMRDEAEDAIARLKIDRWIFILLVLAVAFVPLVIGGYMRDVISPNITNIELTSSGEKGDMFTYFKSLSMMIITLIIISLFMFKILFLDYHINKANLNLFAGLFLISIMISTILSPSISIALWGQYNRSDGAIVYVCYMLLLFVATNINYPKKAIHFIMYSLYPFIFINSILITMNFLGHDAMKYEVVQKSVSLFLPSNSVLEDGFQLLGTLNQWNFMSGMFAVMTVMYLAWAIVDKNKIRSMINSLVAVVAFAIMLMSISTSGFVTVVAVIPLLIVLAIKSNHMKQAAVVFAVFLIVTLPIFHMLAKEDPRVWNESIGFILKKNPYIKEQPIASATEPYSFSLERRAYAADNQFELPVLPERGWSAGSGRIYIWEKTLKLTMERPLFGYGMDTIMYHFPHYNIDARAGMWSEDTIVDKPHNMYIGVLYGTGIIGFIGFMGIVIMTALTAFKVVWTKKHKTFAVLAIGWLAFLLQAMFNDSLPGTAGPMWAIAGIMMGLVFTNNESKEKPESFES